MSEDAQVVQVGEYRFDADLVFVMVRELKRLAHGAIVARRDWPEKDEELRRTDDLIEARSMLRMRELLRKARVGAKTPALPIAVTELDALIHQLYLIAVERGESI
jgi:hypothetical protein